MQRLEIRCDERNRRSAAVAERAGYDREGLFRRDALDPAGNLRNTIIYAKIAATT
jgi:RimJ/RimL family protein N-acetyltransferase